MKTKEDLFEGLRIVEDNFFIHVEAESYQSLVYMLGEHLIETGFVKASFTQAVLDREEVYPTGLEAPGGGIAIPHTDAEHVLTSTICVATLKDPVIFRVMAEPDRKVGVSVVMMLAVSNPAKVIPVLTKVISIVEDAEAVQNLITATSKEQAKQIVVNHIMARYNID